MKHPHSGWLEEAPSMGLPVHTAGHTPDFIRPERVKSDSGRMKCFIRGERVRFDSFTLDEIGQQINAGSVEPLRVHAPWAWF